MVLLAKVIIKCYICKRNYSLHPHKMSNNPINLELMEYVETKILPRYNDFDKAHNLNHVTRVIENAVRLAASTGADVNMVYAIAAYHDLGMSGPRAIHHLTGGKILEADRQLRRWFTETQIKIMKEAVEDHRASAANAPRSLYGKIVAEADRDLEPDVVFRRTVQFGLKNYPEKNRAEHWERFYSHIKSKYGPGGYIHLWIPGSPNESNLTKVRNIISNVPVLKQMFYKIYDEETSAADNK